MHIKHMHTNACHVQPQVQHVWLVLQHACHLYCYVSTLGHERTPALGASNCFAPVYYRRQPIAAICTTSSVHVNIYGKPTQTQMPYCQWNAYDLLCTMLPPFLPAIEPMVAAL